MSGVLDEEGTMRPPFVDPFDDAFVDELLSVPDQASAPAAYWRLMTVLDAARSPGTDAELAGEAAFVAMFRQVVGAPISKRWRRSSKALLAAGILTVVSVSGAAAATGRLPDPAQEVASALLSKIGIDVPDPTWSRSHLVPGLRPSDRAGAPTVVLDLRLPTIIPSTGGQQPSGGPSTPPRAADVAAVEVGAVAATPADALAATDLPPLEPPPAAALAAAPAGEPAPTQSDGPSAPPADPGVAPAEQPDVPPDDVVVGPPADRPGRPPVDPPAGPPLEPPGRPPVDPPAGPPLEPPGRPPVDPPAGPPLEPRGRPPVDPPAGPPLEPPGRPPPGVPGGPPP